MAERIDCNTHREFFSHSLDGQRPIIESGTVRSELLSSDLYVSEQGSILDPQVRVIEKEPLPSLGYTLPYQNKTSQEATTWVLPEGQLDLYDIPDGSQIWQSTESSESYHYHFMMGLDMNAVADYVELAIGHISLQENISKGEAHQIFIPYVRMSPEHGLVFGPNTGVVKITPSDGFQIVSQLPHVEPNEQWDDTMTARRGRNYFEYVAALMQYTDGTGIPLEKQQIVFGVRYMSEQFADIHEAITLSILQGRTEQDLTEIVCPYVRVQEAKQ